MLRAAGQVGPKSYKALFSDPSNNPLGPADEAKQGYKEIFAHWRTTNNPPNADQVLKDAQLDFGAPIGVIGMFVPDGSSPTGVLCVAHGLQCYAGQPGKPSQSRGLTFAFVDEVDGIDIQSFALEETHLERTEEVRIPGTPERLMEMLTDEPDEEMIGPIEDKAVVQKVVRTRKSMFIPFPLVEYVIGKDLTARQAFEMLLPVVDALGLRTHCKQLLTFLVVAVTKPSASNIVPLTLLPQLGRTNVTITPHVTKSRRETTLFRHLPELRPRNHGTADPQMTQLIAGAALLADHQRLDREDRREQREKSAQPTTIREKFGDHTTDLLLLLTGQSDDDDLPEVFHELASRKKGVSERMILQHAVDQAARRLGLPTFRVNVTHVVTMKQWDLVGAGEDELGTGWSIFTITPPGAMSDAGKRQLLEDRTNGSQLDMTGEAVNGTMTAADAKRLTNAKGCIPTEWAEASMQLELCAVLLAAILGDSHPNVRAHQLAYRMCKRHDTPLQHEMNNKFGKRLAPALFVFHFHLRHRQWFDRQWDFQQMSTVPAPDFTQGIELHAEQNCLDWLPECGNIPLLKPLAREQPNNKAIPGSSAGRGAPATPNAATGVDGARRMRNPARDPRFTGNTPFAVNIRTRSIAEAMALAGRPPPMANRNGVQTQRCLSWHLKGQCMSNCARSADHVPLDAPAAEELFQWCQPAFA